MSSSTCADCGEMYYCEPCPFAPDSMGPICEGCAEAWESESNEVDQAKLRAFPKLVEALEAVDYEARVMAGKLGPIPKYQRPYDPYDLNAEHKMLKVTESALALARECGE